MEVAREEPRPAHGRGGHRPAGDRTTHTVADGDDGRHEPRAEEALRGGPLEIRPAEHTAFVHGQPLQLTVRELALLIALARRSERVVGRSELYASVWAGSYRPADRSVDVYVSKLRAKLEAALPEWRYIHTHFGFGYRFSPRPLHDFHRSLTAE